MHPATSAAVTRPLADTRPTILHVAPASLSGGIGAYVLGLVEATRPRWGSSVVDVHVPKLLKRHRVLRPLLSPKFLADLGLQLARERPALVHVHTADFAGFWEKSILAHLARIAGPPVLLHLHGGTFDVFLGGLAGARERLARQLLGVAARVIIPAPGWRSLVERFVAAPRIAVLPNAIRVADFDRPRPPHAPPLRILFLGMISARKGFDELLEAMCEVVEKRPGAVHLDIVGADEVLGATDHFQSLCRTLGLGASVTWHGPAFGVEKLRVLGDADIFVLPSRNESFGIANLEAMASGLAVVSTRTGAIPDYLEDGVHGVLVEPRDARGLAAALVRLADDAALRARLGEAARVRARDYDWSVVAPQVEALYAAVLAESERA